MATFLLEVGTEELPASFVAEAITQWQTNIPQALGAENLTPSAVQVWGTPRRLAVLIEGLPERQADRTEEVKGPPAQAAFKDGQPTKAAEGFARKQGVSVADLEVRPTPKGDFVFVEKTIPGQAVPDLLQGLIPGWITGLEGKRFMRWGTGDLRFPRPIRWLVVLWGDRVLPVQLETGGSVLVSDRVSQGHRVLHPQPVTLASADRYPESLRAASVLVDPAERDRVITDALVAAARSKAGVTLYPPELKAEVVHLVEWPTAVVGSFDPSFLALPSAVITTVMISHQRYFPIYQVNPDCTPSDILLPHFITISNGDPAKNEVIAAGNGRVIQARLADGKFFYDADCRQPLETFLPELEKVTFQAKLGSVADKVRRIAAVADRISQQLNLSTETQHHIQRAVTLCKTHLV
ncbi:MAG: glycine--tRNA ligase subunit beta, partial [Prochlorothrix sp.]